MPTSADGRPRLGPPTATFDEPEQPKLDFRQETLTGFTSLFGFAGEALIQNINRHRVRRVVAAARQFGPPVIGRASRYEGCQLIVSENAVPDVAVQVKRQDRLSVQQIELNRVVRVETDVHWGERDEKLTVYYAKPKPTVLIAATDVGFLRTVLRQVARTPTRTPLLDFPEWKHVNARAPVWGIRHRRTATPFYILAQPSKDGYPFSELRGVTYFYEPQPAKCVKLHLHFTERAKAVLPKAVAKDPSGRLIGPLVARRELALGEQSGEDGRSRGSPMAAAFMIQHLIGYVVCP